MCFSTSCYKVHNGWSRVKVRHVLRQARRKLRFLLSEMIRDSPCFMFVAYEQANPNVLSPYEAEPGSTCGKCLVGRVFEHCFGCFEGED
jgi:hypothetical protein